MSFRAEVVYNLPDYTETVHREEESRHALYVGHERRDGADSPFVALDEPQKSSHRTQLLHDRANGEAFIVSGSPGLRPQQDGTQVAEPSPELQTLIATHHLDPTNSWMPLLDKLVEEYPEHFDGPVAAHTAARSSDAAAQYARAFADSQRTRGVG